MFLETLSSWVCVVFFEHMNGLGFLLTHAPLPLASRRSKDQTRPLADKAAMASPYVLSPPHFLFRAANPGRQLTSEGRVELHMQQIGRAHV